MNFLYVGAGALYLPAAAAALHLQKLNGQELPQERELAGLKHFRHASKDEEGKLHLAGRDRQNHNVFISYVPAHPDVVAHAVRSLLGVFLAPPDRMRVIICEPQNSILPFYMNILKRVGLNRTEEKLACLLVRSNFQYIKKMCEYAKG